MVVQFSGTSQEEEHNYPFMMTFSSVQQLMNIYVPFYSIDIGKSNFTHNISLLVPKEFFNITAIS